MDLSSTFVLGYAMLSLQGCLPCIFVINVVTSTSMQSSSRNIVDFRDLEFHQVISLLFIFMPCFHVAIVRSMLLLSMISKDDVGTWS